MHNGIAEICTMKLLKVAQWCGKFVKDISDNVTNEDLMVTRNTVADYLNILNKLNLIEDQTSFMYKIRSRANVGKTPKRHFSDPSIGCAMLI